MEKEMGKVNGCRLHNLILKKSFSPQVQQYSQIRRIYIQDDIHMNEYHHYK